MERVRERGYVLVMRVAGEGMGSTSLKEQLPVCSCVCCGRTLGLHVLGGWGVGMLLGWAEWLYLPPLHPLLRNLTRTLRKPSAATSGWLR